MSKQRYQILQFPHGLVGYFLGVASAIVEDMGLVTKDTSEINKPFQWMTEVPKSV